MTTISTAYNDDGITETAAPLSLDGNEVTSIDDKESAQQSSLSIRSSSNNMLSMNDSFDDVHNLYKHSSARQHHSSHSHNHNHHTNNMSGVLRARSLDNPSNNLSTLNNGGLANGSLSSSSHKLSMLSMVHAPCWCDVCGLLVVAAREPSLYCSIGCGYRVHQHCRSYVPIHGGCIDLQSEEESWLIVADNEWRMPASTASWLATPHLLAMMLSYLREDDLCVIRCAHTRLRQAVDRKGVWADLGFRFLHIPSLFNFNTNATPLPASSVRLSPSSTTTAAFMLSSSSSVSSSSIASTNNNGNSNSVIPDFAIALSLGLDPPRLPAAITIAIHAPLNIRDRMYSWLFGPEFCEQVGLAFFLPYHPPIELHCPQQYNQSSHARNLCCCDSIVHISIVLICISVPSLRLVVRSFQY
jgi:hypothetical protein